MTDQTAAAATSQPTQQTIGFDTSVTIIPMLQLLYALQSKLIFSFVVGFFLPLVTTPPPTHPAMWEEDMIDFQSIYENVKMSEHVKMCHSMHSLSCTSLPKG